MKEYIEPKEARKIIYRHMTEVIVRTPREEAKKLLGFIDMLYDIDSCPICREREFYESMSPYHTD